MHDFFMSRSIFPAGRGPYLYARPSPAAGMQMTREGI
jgi:hypothetical protein